MSLIQHNDTEGKIISSGGVVVRKEHSYAEFQEVQWNINQNEFTQNTLGNRIIKFELRRTPRNEKIEDIQLRWEEENPTGVDFNKFPTFWGCLGSIRVLINNKEVVDLKTAEGIRNQFKTCLYARHRDRQERDYHWSWITRGEPFLQDSTLGDPLMNVPLLTAGETRRYTATMNDILPGIFESLPLDKIFLIEIECKVLPDNKSFLTGSVVESTQTICKNLQMWSKHKRYLLKVPRPFSNWTLFHHEHEVVRISAPSNAHVGGTGEINIDLHTLVPRRSLIQRIIVYSQVKDFGADGYRNQSARSVLSMRLERNGDDVLGTRYFYSNRREVAKQVQKYYKRHHGGVCSINGTPTLNSFYGASLPEFFIDTTPVLKSLNANPSVESKVVASEGIDNHTNLNLIVNLEPTSLLANFEDLIVIVEYQQFDRINPSGNVIRIQTP